ncbi:MAG: hypothetical protein RL351_418 [Actinomycetota bacterium]
MSTAKTEFEPREAIQGLFNYVKDMAVGAVSRPSSTQPGEEQVDAAVLGALESGPKTATQISKAIAVSAAGAWAPTDGQINKALTKLADTDMVAVKTKADRKTYSITDEGQAALDLAKENLNSTAPRTSSKMNMNFNWMTCDPKFLTAASKLPPVMLDIAQTGTKEQQMKAAAILDKARHDLHVVLAEK